MVPMLPERGPGPCVGACLRAGKLHHGSPDNDEGTFVKAGAVTQERTEQRGSERRAEAGLLELSGKSEERVLGNRFRGPAAAAHCCLVASHMGSLRV